MNTQQQWIAQSPELWNIVLAGPGSGKTFTIIERAKMLKARGVDPKSMAFVTFTNIGASVLRRRLKETVGDVGFVGTLHAMMLRLLRQADRRWIMVNEDDAAAFLARYAKTVGYTGTATKLEAAAREIEETDGFVTPELRVVRAYRDFMRRERMLDFSMVLTEGLALIKEHGQPWSAWFVDEFQDSAPIDMDIYRTANPEHLLIVGDPDQAIYRFRGASLDAFDKAWNSKMFEPHTLEANYRCSARVCDVANAVAGRIRHRIKKSVSCATMVDGEVRTHAFSNDLTEARAYPEMIKERLNRGVAPGDIAVLCRTNRLAHQIRDELQAAGVPVCWTETEKKPKDWRLLTMLIQQIASPESWPNARLLAREQARIQKKDPDEAEKVVMGYDFMVTTPAEVWSLPSAKVVLSLNADFSRYGVGKAAHELLRQRIRVYGPSTLDELLDAMRESPESKHHLGVNVMTVHAAKGEEFDSVFVPGAELYSAGSEEELDEELRVFFVAVTRAKRFLVVTSCASRSTKLPNNAIVNKDYGPSAAWEAATSTQLIAV